MTCIQALLSLLLISPCAERGGQTANLAIDPAITHALTHPQRMKGDRALDPMRKPDQVLAFFEIEPGMRVFDLFSGGGYYTEILRRTTGPDGGVVSQNNLACIDYASEEIAIRFAGKRLSNVTQLIAEADAL